MFEYYGVLIRISPGYPPVQGRLHTRYAPVRRSPPNKQACFMLPLDLHVLGLPLAFILSQDQTLRCIKLWILLTAHVFKFLRCFLISQSFKELFWTSRLKDFKTSRLNRLCFLKPASRSIWEGKGNHFFVSNKQLWKYFSLFCQSPIFFD